jgi:RNA polymerase sigma factor (sigma-70 family)
VVIDTRVHDVGAVSAFFDDARCRLERALVARFGVDDGLDAAAEAMAYAVEHWDRLEPMANPIGYLYRVGQTRGRRLARRWHRLDALVHEPLTSDGVIDVDLQRALLRLKPRERVAVVLVHAHGHTYREAAEVLDVPVTTVTNHVSRGMARLRRILER